MSLPNLITIFHISSGITSILLALTGHITLACSFILFSVLLDGGDGYLARKLKLESKLGAYLDSIADFVTFGIAACTTWFYSVSSDAHLKYSIVLLSACVFFFLSACLFRLIRFHMNLSSYKPYYIGLPCTAAGAFIAIYLIFFSPGNNQILSAYVLLPSLSILMSCSILYPKPSELIRIVSLGGKIALLLFSTIIFFLWNIEAVLLFLLLVYLLVSPLKFAFDKFPGKVARTQIS